MKRLFLLLLALGISAALFKLGDNVWDTTRYIQDNGREATLVIGKRYNEELWAKPLPLKKIYTYEAKLEPKYEVLVETDQELSPKDVVSIRFLTRDLAPGLRAFSYRPVANSLRLRDSADGAPVKLADTDLFDNLVDKAMGPPAPGVRVREHVVAEAAPDRAKATVPFLIAKPGDSTWTLLWTNSRIGEWVALSLLVLAVPSLLSSAWERHKAARRPNPNSRKFVHPSLRRIEADASDAPQKKISYVPKPEEDIVLTEAEKRRVAAEQAARVAPPASPAPVPSQPAPAPTPAPVDDAPLAPAAGELPSLSSSETAPPMPIPQNEPTLKLRRNKPGGGAS